MTIASHNRTRLDRITDLAVRWRMVGFVLAVAVTLCAFPVAQGLTYNRSIESLYSPDDPDLQAFEDSKSLFGGDEFAVVAYVDPNLMADDGRSLHEDAEERLEAFADRLSRVPGVIPAATQHLAIALRRRFMRERVREMAEDFLVGRDNQTTAIVLRLASRNDTDVDLANVLSELNHTASAVSSANPGDQTHLTAIRRLCREYRDEFGKAQAITDVGELLAGFQSDDDPGEVVAAIRDLAGGGPPSLSESGTPGEICLLLSEQPDADPRTSIKDVRRLLNARRAAVVHAETLSEIRFLAKDESEASTGPSDIMLRVRRLLGRIGVYVERATTIREIRRLAAEHDPPAFVVGEPVQIHDMFQIVEEDADLLFGVSMALLSTVILVLFRQLRWVLLPVAVVIMTIKWTEAFFAVGGFRLSMVSSMLNSMVTIIGIATVTHITVHYRDARRESTATDALRQTLSDLLPGPWVLRHCWPATSSPCAVSA